MIENSAHEFDWSSDIGWGGPPVKRSKNQLGSSQKQSLINQMLDAIDDNEKFVQLCSNYSISNLSTELEGIDTQIKNIKEDNKRSVLEVRKLQNKIEANDIDLKNFCNIYEQLRQILINKIQNMDLVKLKLEKE